MNTIWKTVCAVVIVGLMSLQAQAEEKTITMGTMNWEDLTPITGVTKKVLENAGYTVKVIEFSEWGIAYAALTKGDVQVLASQTDYAASDYWNKNKNKLEKLSPVSFGLYQGLAVPRYVDIDSIEQLNAHSEQLGGKIIGIEPGSGLMSDAADVVKAYDLTLKLIEGSTSAMTAALKSAVDRKEWVAVTVWDPSWMTKKFDLKFLKDPKGILPPLQGYYWIGHKGFAEANPRARELMASVYVPIADITSMNAEVKDGKTMDQAVQGWTDSHSDLLKRWGNVKN
ncbi:ABC-type proline/glycine betaine transport system, periplasmic component [Pseudomonas caricapapayae]|uniref:ABC-type proline/glycine betaine transport system n=1 Tax=Pseudomonas caricapapayae TaxID=46678 RepID=A0A0P9KDN6_9PSED|nr:glycine betaine ABC transporter substrate-binding protein [Pseudomonas caricapapayae]KAA8697590.1 glycine betaine ABC transporter substrate-binding protein [Pseudomonas caricapapayae]KPW53488.1 ABC-type proline/glycine betaine transport system, periplasmic component [Pseudomonas caricapapayae]RMM12669.1 ABC-type proline/glycine betaine transport system [Pseudomonas caricapapayae]RMV99745.1 ABC-type proline/glycine betaine transport system [Pseudomonas caricapapayae]